LRGRTNAGSGRCSEKRHLQSAVFLKLEPVCCRDGLTDGEAEFLTAIVDATPLRGRPISSKVGGKVDRRLKVGSIDQDGHLRNPGHEYQNGRRPRDGFREGPDQRHDKPSQIVRVSITAVIGCTVVYKFSAACSKVEHDVSQPAYSCTVRQRTSRENARFFERMARARGWPWLCSN
jgi:hypothetical protein